MSSTILDKRRARRVEVVHFRCTPAFKLALESATQRAGMQSVAEFVGHACAIVHQAYGYGELPPR